ncbi:hypothetical protein Dgeo_3101 (plasmid) [Deinococcus geothermalis DSM 11300]|uniref:Uncharacterized protein n=1 Tax=Deinococcus geothermalis (strain DSM 11300 / CIP 105573 / AG-3a) TaxID=319795 RepID=A8ZRN1_DEIGD|nr:hypothetical protein Dgeo_3101 [Deinococcus geothermalis DSM 11300]
MGTRAPLHYITSSQPLPGDGAGEITLHHGTDLKVFVSHHVVCADHFLYRLVLKSRCVKVLPLRPGNLLNGLSALIAPFLMSGPSALLDAQFLQAAS